MDTYLDCYIDYNDERNDYDHAIPWPFLTIHLQSNGTAYPCVKQSVDTDWRRRLGTCIKIDTKLFEATTAKQGVASKRPDATIDVFSACLCPFSPTCLRQLTWRTKVVKCNPIKSYKSSCGWILHLLIPNSKRKRFTNLHCDAQQLLRSWLIWWYTFYTRKIRTCDI